MCSCQFYLLMHKQKKTETFFHNMFAVMRMLKYEIQSDKQKQSTSTTKLFNEGNNLKKKINSHTLKCFPKTK